ncbi:PEPxxWA-CTERM sorting domain-containing protein [Sandarakinorhabdus sp.]|uniref:Npun_F0296 family exosortase-dependent surface protein n=1 Tax=Sandarakinorhabdus sp. TaxID=1916663 RepID=UPI00286E4A65|nr:PEPxxWA-CTERM sorting domain-containing protein [Sandarakinorhabdus sp.]
MSVRLALVLLAALTASAASATATIPFTVSLETEAAGIQNSTSGFSAVGVERFNARATGAGQNFTSNFGGNDFTGRYTGVQINRADRFGGAGGNGKYAVTFSSAGYSLDLAATTGKVTYFGFWLSALDRGNQVSFLKGGETLFTFTASDARSFINGLPNRASYSCNPNAAFANQNCGEPYAFLNFYARGGASFDRIVFAENPQVGGYESDNHTVGRWNRISGTPIDITGTVAGVPEPSSWAMLIAGFGLVGAGMRRRRTAIA